MPRPLRLEYPGAWWHVHSRGVDRTDIYLDDRDRRHFLDLLAVTIPRYRWHLHAYVLMPNHYHLLVETVEPTLSRGMKKIGGDYATWFNKRHRRVGHLFQGRFKAHLIDCDEYLLTVARYIVLNPVRAHLVDDALQWKWSSARAMAGSAIVPDWLSTRTILRCFHTSDAAASQRLYRAFIHDVGAARSPWKELVDQIYLGSEDFRERVRQLTGNGSSLPPRRPERLLSPDEVRRAVQAVTGEAPAKGAASSARMAYAVLARSEALECLREIGRTLGVLAAAAWKLVVRGQKLEKEDRNFSDLLDRIRLQIKKDKG